MFFLDFIKETEFYFVKEIDLFAKVFIWLGTAEPAVRQ